MEECLEVKGRTESAVMNGSSQDPDTQRGDHCTVTWSAGQEVATADTDNTKVTVEDYKAGNIL